MDKQQRRESIARRIARELRDGDVVNLGIGLPTMVADFVPHEVDIILHSENGFVHMGPTPEPGQEDHDLIDAGGQPVTIFPGGAFFDSALSFALIRGGHIDVTVLGTLQVDAKGNVASWNIPGKFVPGIGGCMDLLVGASKVIIATDHLTKHGEPKILAECTLPLSAKGAADLIVTDMAVIEITPDGALLKEIAPHVTLEEVLQATGAPLIVSDDMKTMDIC